MCVGVCWCWWAWVAARGGETFIVDSIHALEILERNQAKAEEERWMGLLTPFDAAATLQCVKFLLQQVATGALPAPTH